MIDESKYFRLQEGILPIAFYCPGCEMYHGIDKTWQITFSEEKPTVHPSVRVQYYNGKKDMTCHLFIKDGKIQYLMDSTHNLAGKIVDMKKEKDALWIRS